MTSTLSFRERVYFRDLGRCYLCNKTTRLKGKQQHPLFATIDHVIPIARGGTNHLTNVRLCCLSCNQKKADRILT